MKHAIEIFTAGCHICRETLEIVEKARCDECILTEHDMTEKCDTGICLEKAEEYGIKAIPTIVVDGRVAIVGKPTEGRVREVLGL